MKKWMIPVCVLGVLGAAAAALAIWIWSPRALPDAVVIDSDCPSHGITFDDSSAQSIYADPEVILEDPSGFWDQDKAYRLVSMAPKHRGKTLPPEGWISEIERLAKKDPSDRLQDAVYVRTAQIAEHSDDFCSIAVPVITSMLPQDADLTTTVYTSLLNDPAAFAYRSNVVMNADAPGYFGQSSIFFNVLAHESFHIGYFNHQPHQTEVWPDNYGLHVLLTTLQNDGIAVYTQYVLTESYSKPADFELLTLNSRLAINVLTRRLNRLLSEAEKVEVGDPMVTAFTGLNQKALYSVGAHMARTIDERLGRDVLRETVATGPRAFIMAYNSVVEPGQRIHEVAEPDELSAIQVIRKAAVEDEPLHLRAALDTLESSAMEPGGETFEHLTSAGQVLLDRDQPGLAVEVFQVLVELFPQHPFAHQHLAEAYRANGEPISAERSYDRAIDFEPRLRAAFDL